MRWNKAIKKLMTEGRARERGRRERLREVAKGLGDLHMQTISDGVQAITEKKKPLGLDANELIRIITGEEGDDGGESISSGGDREDKERESGDSRREAGGD